MGYGHTVPVPPETQIADHSAGGGPALDCGNPASPFYAPKSANTVATADTAVNLTSGDLALGGTAAGDVTSVGITLSDGDPATPDPTTSASELASGPGDKGWSVSFPRDQVEALSDGTLTATGLYTRDDGSTATGIAKKILKDTDAPGAPTATPDAGLYAGVQAVTLEAEEGAQIRYTVDGPDPTAATGQAFGAQIQIPSSRTIRARAFDEAGNASAVATLAYEIDAAAPTVNASLPAGTYDPDPSREVSLSASEEADVYFTTNGSLPSPGGPGTTRGTGPVPLDRTTTFKVVAVDRAGNVGPVATFGYVIRQPTGVSLRAATGNLRLGETRPLTGSVSPAGVGRSVSMTIYTRGIASNVTKTLPLDGASRYRFSYKPKVAGRYSVRVSFLEDADNLGSTSPLVGFRVIR